MSSIKYWYALSIISSCALVFPTSHASYASTSKEQRTLTLREKLEYAAFKHVLMPAYCTWHDLKETELSYADVLATGAAAGVCYGLKKLNNKTQCITHSVIRGCAAGKNILGYMLDNKTKTAATIGTFGALWYIYNAVRADVAHSQITIEGFFKGLTKEQRSIIAQSPDLTVLKQQAYDDPACLLDNEEFMELLSPEQKEYLDKVILLPDFNY